MPSGKSSKSWKRIHPEGFRKYRNKQRKINYQRGNFGKDEKLHTYSFDDEIAILQHIILDRELAKRLLVSVEAIQAKRCRLLK